MNAKKVPMRHLLAYAAPGLALALMIPPFPAMMAAFYVKYTAATAAGIATVLLLSRIIDAVVDPSIGHFSDRTRTRLGARKPWMLGGSLLGVLAFYVLFMPPESAGDLRFFFGMTLYYIALAAIDIPMRAWAGEITTDYRERSRIAAHLTTSLLVGGVLFMLLPEVLASPAVGLVATPELNRTMYGIFGAIGMVLLPLMIVWAVTSVPVGSGVSHADQRSLMDMFRAVRGNRPFWIFLVADALTQVGYGAFYAVLFVALDSHYGLGPKVPILILAVILVQVFTVPAVTWFANRIGKHHTWAWAWVLHTILLPFVLFFGPGRTDFLLFTAFACSLAILQTPQMMLAMAILNDISDYDTLKSGESRGGIYFALRMLSFKGLYAVGSAAGFFLLSLFNYDPKSMNNPESAQLGLLLAIVGIPSVCFLVSALFLFRFPIDARRHAIIRKRIERRRLAATQA